MITVLSVSTNNVLQFHSKHDQCVFSTDGLVFQGEICCGQKVRGKMYRPRVCCEVHEEETERPGLPNGDHP